MSHKLPGCSYLIKYFEYGYFVNSTFTKTRLTCGRYKVSISVKHFKLNLYLPV